MKKRVLLAKKIILLAPIVHAAANSPTVRREVNRGLEKAKNELQLMEERAGNPELGIVSGEKYPMGWKVKADKLAANVPAGSFQKAAKTVDFTHKKLALMADRMDDMLAAHLMAVKDSRSGCCGPNCSCTKNGCDCGDKNKATVDSTEVGGESKMNNDDSSNEQEKKDSLES